LQILNDNISPFIFRSLYVAASSSKTLFQSYRSADSEERANRARVLCYVYLESIATVALGWNTRYEDMRYGRLIREIKIESGA